MIFSSTSRHVLTMGIMFAGIIYSQVSGYAKTGQDAKSKIALPCLAKWAKTANIDTPKTLREAFVWGPFVNSGHPTHASRITFPAATASKGVEDYIDHGIFLLHGFWYNEAERAFRQAVALDDSSAAGYWGLAIANEGNPGRAAFFAREAVVRAQRKSSESGIVGSFEQRWVEAFAPVLTLGTNDEDDERETALREHVHALESIVIDFPDEPEARAFLLRQVVLNAYRGGIPVASRLGVVALADSLAALAPRHPAASVYPVFLWLGERPEIAMSAARELLIGLPGVPDAHRYIGEASAAAGELEQGVVHYLTALEQDLRLLSDPLAGQKIPQNLASNFSAAIGALSGLGAIDEAMSLARVGLALPRLPPGHPRYGEKEASPYHAVVAAAASTLVRHHRWDALAALEKTLPLSPEPDLVDRASRHYWQALAALGNGNIEGAHDAAADLANLGSAEGNARSADLEMITRFTTKATLEESAHSAIWSTASPQHFDPFSLALLRLRKQGGDALQDLVPPETAAVSPAERVALCEIFHATGQMRQALFQFDQKLRTQVAKASPSTGWIPRLKPLADTLSLGENWAAPGKPSRESAYAIPTYTPPIAPPWELSESPGTTRSLSAYQGKPVLLIFYLGSGCIHCIEQLNAFYPRCSAYQEVGIPIVAISTDSPNALHTTLEEERKLQETLPFDVVSDHKLQAFRHYGVYDDYDNRPLHGTFLISPEGKVLWSTIGNEPFMEPTWLLIEAKRLLAIHR